MWYQLYARLSATQYFPGAHFATGVGFAEASYDESGHAARVAQALGSAHYEERLDLETAIDLLPEVAGGYGIMITRTVMDEFEYRREDGGTGPGPAKLSETRSYRLEPGQGALFDVGTIHRIDYPAGSRFVRISGADMETVPRIKYDLEAGEAIEMAGIAVPD